MSRSYCKVRKYKEVWFNKSFRARNLMCVRQEIKSGDLGEVVFPVYKECVRVLGRHEPPVSKREIRDGYFLEIRNILNGYVSHSRYHYEAPDESFIEQCNRIKGLVPENGRKYEFEWLNLKRVQQVVKTCIGEPPEILKVLTDSGFIEEAVRREFKLSTRK